MHLRGQREVASNASLRIRRTIRSGWCPTRCTISRSTVEQHSTFARSGQGLPEASRVRVLLLPPLDREVRQRTEHSRVARDYFQWTEDLRGSMRLPRGDHFLPPGPARLASTEANDP